MRKLYIPPSLIAYCILSMLACWLFLPEFNFMKFPFNLAGLLMSISGFLVMGQARDLFKKYKTTLDIEPSSYFIKEGIFTKTRNPMYLGMSLFLMGIAVITTSVLSLLFPFVFLLLIRLIFIPKEEKLMEDVFGAEFLEYKKSVRRWV